jgi:hypothetical protein
MILTIHSTNKCHANNALLKHDVSFKGLAVTVDMFKYRIKKKFLSTEQNHFFVKF